MGYGKVPVCIAKTQYSFSTNPDAKGAPTDHVVAVREVRLSAGAEFVVAACGDIMTMPRLPRGPAADSIDLNAEGNIVGLVSAPPPPRGASTISGITSAFCARNHSRS